MSIPVIVWGETAVFRCRALQAAWPFIIRTLAPVFMAYDARAVMFDGAKEIEIPVETVIHRHSLGELGRDIRIGHSHSAWRGWFKREYL